jgi:hypothetical protein
MIRPLFFYFEEKMVPGAGIEPAKEAIIISDKLCYIVI